MVIDLIFSDRVDSLATLGIKVDRIAHMIRLPHVEGTCPHGTSFLLGEGLLGDAHLVLDVVDGVGEHSSCHGLHVVEPPVGKRSNIDRYVEVCHLTVL